MSRKVIAICIMIFAILITSCAPQATPTTSQPAENEGSKAPETEAPEAPSSEKVKIELWVGDWGACFKPIIAEKINPQAETFEVVIVDIPMTGADTQRAALSTGGGPDIVITAGPAEAREYSKAGLNIPLDPYVEKYGWDERFAPWAMNLSSLNGQLYSIQAELETMILYYNKTLFEEKGYQPPKTYDEMVAVAEQMKEDGIIPFASAVGDMKWPTDYVYAEYLNAIAGPDAVYEALTGKRSWTDPVFVETFTELSDQAKAGWFMGGLDSYFTKTWDEQWAALGTGEAGMTIQGTWMFPGMSIEDYFKDTGNTWDWLPMPRKAGEPVFDIGLGSAWAINKYSKHPDEAAEFLDMWFQPELQIELLKTSCVAPAAVVVPESATADLDPRVSAVYKAMNEAFASGNYGYTTWTFWPPELQLYMQKGLEDVYNDTLTVEDFLKGTDEIMKKELEAGNAPPIPSR